MNKLDEENMINLNNEMVKRARFDKIIQYLLNNHLAIIALIVAIIGLFK